MVGLIEEMGSIDEQIKDNHSSEHLFKAIDWTLFKSIELVVEHTYLFEEVLGVYFNTPTRKKISNTTPDELAELCYNFYNGSFENKVESLKKARINRELLTLPVQLVASKCDDYCSSMVNGTMETWTIGQELMLRDPKINAAMILLQVKIWFDRYLELRSAVMEKYYRMIVKDIGKYTHVIAGKVDKNDMATEYILSFLRAFSKFDTTSGAFTGYLTNWLKNARSNSMTTDETGIAYTLPHNVRTKIGQGKGYADVHNFSMPQDEDASVDPIESLEDKDESDAFSLLLATADPEGMYRLLYDFPLDIPEILALN